jgi:hypothetical protein
MLQTCNRDILSWNPGWVISHHDGGVFFFVAVLNQTRQTLGWVSVSIKPTPRSYKFFPIHRSSYHPTLSRILTPQESSTKLLKMPISRFAKTSEVSPLSSCPCILQKEFYDSHASVTGATYRMYQIIVT